MTIVNYDTPTCDILKEGVNFDTPSYLFMKSSELL